jgi:hypothetical protein
VKREFRHRTGEDIEACPSCKNRQHFIGLSQQVAEDLCEVWVRCICGYDATEGRSGDRMEDVMGSLDAGNLVCALENCWNEPLRRRGHPTVGDERNA